MNTPNNTQNNIPLYQKEFYESFYNNKSLNDFLSQRMVQQLITLGAADEMMLDVQQEIKSSMRVLQLGITFGPLIQYVAERVSSKGQYDIVDTNITQIQRAKSE